MAHNHKIRVLIADDHEILRMGLAIFLEGFEDILLVGEAANGQEAVELCEKLIPDVVLMDISMPLMDGIAATRMIVGQNPQIAVVMLTSSFNGNNEEEALQAGARGYITKTANTIKIADTIRAVAS
jgi:two-component system, NarL family, response regulator LiaR